MGEPVQHDLRKVAFHSPASRLPTRGIPHPVRRRFVTCARRQTTFLPSGLQASPDAHPLVPVSGLSHPSAPAPVHLLLVQRPRVDDLGWFRAKESPLLTTDPALLYRTRN